MPHINKVLGSVLVLVAFVFLSAATARADIIVIQGVNNQGTDNVNLVPADDDTSVIGEIGTNSGVFAEFVSASGSGLLDADPSGQATISGGLGNAPFTSIEFFIQGGGTFTRAVFNINAETDGMVRITVEGINIDGGTFVNTYEVDANGENFFTVTAINGQLMTSILLEGVDGATFQDLRQVRIGQGEQQNPIPEPMTMVLLGTGLAGVAAKVRRRRRQAD